MAAHPKYALLAPILLILFSATTATPSGRSHSPAPQPSLAPLAAPPAPAPSPALAGPDCSTALLNLSACLTYVEQGANLTVPEKGCCPSLAGLVDSNPICLCQLLSTSDIFGIKIDDTRALSLPTICRVQTPPVSLCNDLGIPVPSPVALSPAAAGGQTSGSGPVAPASQSPGTPSNGGDGRSAAGVAALLALLATAGQAAVMILF